MQKTFSYSTKRCILEYALICPSTAKRLGLFTLLPLLQHQAAEQARYRGPLFLSIPKAWRLNYRKHRSRLSRRLHRHGVCHLRLRDMWVNSFEKKLLTQTGEDLKEKMPITVPEFKQEQVTEGFSALLAYIPSLWQSQICEQRRAHLLTSWNPRAVFFLSCWMRMQFYLISERRWMLFKADRQKQLSHFLETICSPLKLSSMSS